MESPFCIDSRVLGTEKHLLCDGGYTWVRDVPAETWHLTGELGLSDWCLDTVLHLAHRELDLLPPKQFARAMEIVAPDTTPPWSKVMPALAHRAFTRALIERVEESLAQVDKSYYETVWRSGNAVLRSLGRATVDPSAWRFLMARRDGNVSALRSFHPDEDGRADPILYDRLGTRTGRLKVLSGPNIMTLKTTQRGHLLRSRYGDEGAVIMLDFGQLEARVLLYEANRRTEGRDLYQALNSELFDGKMDRDAIKGAVISELYGQGRKALGERLGMSGRKLNAFSRKMKNHFATRNLLKRIKPTFIETGGIHNRHGRWIEVVEPADHIIVNSYAQSTGVDVTMLGFHIIVGALAGDDVLPIFLLHDAIFLDCPLDSLRSVQAVANEGLVVPGYVQRFPLRLETVH